jgi:RNA polymerase sigma-70 factor (ECF subfamily)
VAGNDEKPASSELELVRAVCAGDAAAMASFEAHFISAVPRFVRKVDASPAFAGEVQQTLRVHLLVGEGGRPPRLAAFVGRGSLAAFVRVAALRVAIDIVRSRGNRQIEKPDDTDQIDAWPIGAEPEMDYLKARYRSAFSRAFADSLLALGPDERTLLRLAHCDGLTLSELARLQGVHLSTVSRRLHALRRQVIENTRARLADALGLASHDVSSLIRMVASRIDVSLGVDFSAKSRE